MISNGAALITGASSGIGAVYADRLARRGHALILVARDTKRLEALASRLCAQSRIRADVLTADLTQREQLALVEDRLRTDPSIDILVNAAGATMRSAVVGTPLEAMDSLIELNVVALTHLSSVAADSFVKRRLGTIVNLSSGVVATPEKYRGIYGATKAYVLNFSISLSAEVQANGVQVQVVVPHATRTEIFQRAGKDIGSFESASIMEPEDLVDAALTGLDRGEVVTIPSLPDAGIWDALTSARMRLGAHLAHGQPADRYRSNE